jgi:PAS domain S-box-containing protein
MRRADDSTMWAQLIGYVVNPEDPTAGTIWVIEDRTEQKRAEEALRNALLENQAILDSAVLGISVVENGRNLRCNRKMEELFGYGPGEMNHLSVQAFYADKVAWEQARAETIRDFRAGQVNVSEYELVRKDGTTFWARLSGRPFDLAQNSGRSVWLVDDITTRREAAEAVAARATNWNCGCRNARPNWPAPTPSCKARSSSAARPRRACITWRITTA